MAEWRALSRCGWLVANIGYILVAMSFIGNTNDYNGPSPPTVMFARRVVRDWGAGSINKINYLGH
jgi:hypothetical protein